MSPMPKPTPKRPPVTERRPGDLTAQIAAELYTAVQHLLSADGERLGFPGTYERR
jgi:hypothetical protein